MMARWLRLITVLVLLRTTNLESDEPCQIHLSLLKWPQLTCTKVDTKFFQSFDRPLNRSHWFVCVNCSLGTLDERTFRFSKNNISFLELPNSDITTLKKLAFSQFLLLKVLNLRGNRIEYLEPKCFGNIKRLLQLDLSYNALKIVTNNIFSDLVNLDLLNLNRNQIFYVQPYAFAGLVNLKYLYLNNNDLKKLEDKMFSHLVNLKILYVENNSIVEIHQNAFHNMRSLQYLYLNNNSISFLVQYNFKPLASLIDLQLRSNNLEEIQISSFNGLKNLKYLYLGDNRITTVKPYGFIGLDSLRVLELVQNHFEHVDFNFFDKMENLFVMWLNRNSIKSFTLSHKSEVQRSLHVIDLSFNQLTELDFKLLYSKIPNVKEIFMTNNSFACDSFTNMYDYFKDRNVSVCLSPDCSSSDIDTYLDVVCIEELLPNTTDVYSTTDYTTASAMALHSHALLCFCVASIAAGFLLR